MAKEVNKTSFLFTGLFRENEFASSQNTLTIRYRSHDLLGFPRAYQEVPEHPLLAQFFFGGVHNFFHYRFISFHDS